MKGWVFRRAVALKELGERRRIGFLVRLGLRIRERAMKPPVNYFQ